MGQGVRDKDLKEGKAEATLAVGTVPGDIWAQKAERMLAPCSVLHCFWYPGGSHYRICSVCA